MDYLDPEAPGITLGIVLSRSPKRTQGLVSDPATAFSLSILWIEKCKFTIMACMHAHLCPTFCNPMDQPARSRQEYWSGLPFSSPAVRPDPGIKPTPPASPALHTDSLPVSLGSPKSTITGMQNSVEGRAISLRTCSI